MIIYLFILNIFVRMAEFIIKPWSIFPSLKLLLPLISHLCWECVQQWPVNNTSSHSILHRVSSIHKSVFCSRASSNITWSKGRCRRIESCSVLTSRSVRTSREARVAQPAYQNAISDRQCMCKYITRKKERKKDTGLLKYRW